jgi:hypothetical protein
MNGVTQAFSGNSNPYPVAVVKRSSPFPVEQRCFKS